MQGQSIAVLCADEPLDDAERSAQRLSIRLGEVLGAGIVVVGGSSPCAHARELPAAYREAQIALDVARQLGRTGSVVYDRAGVVGLLLSRSHFESGKSVFELNEGQHHDHLLCLTCGRVEEFYDPEIEKRQRTIAHTKGFELHDHALSLYAVCTKKDCPHRPR